jgi:hypothetical protein
MDLRQFKLDNDEEIICEVMEWNNEETSTLVVRRALKIVALDDLEGSMRYYTFKPWMLMNNDPESLQVLNSTHIVSESSPTKVATEYYYDVIKELSEADEPEVELLSFDSFDDDSAGETNILH